MEIVEPGLKLIAVTYPASRDLWVKTAAYRAEWGLPRLTLVHSNLKFPIYRLRGDVQDELPDEMEAFASP